LLVNDGQLKLSNDAKENRSRPAVDPLFRSAARAYRDQVIGVILSGELDDGVAGLFAIKARGGVTIVQDPNEATAPSMPKRALESVEVDHVLPLARMAPLLVKLTQEKRMATKQSNRPNRLAGSRRATPRDEVTETPGTPVPLACPDCSGPLFEVKNGKLVQFRCIVRHSFSPVSLSDAHADALERALWVAIRTLKERLTFQRRLLNKHANKQEKDLARRMGEHADSIARDIELLEQVQARI
jgi:two-component system chemotaxis response regulator CheB